MPLKILYGVQGTGNGHISRARKMADHLARRDDVEVTWLFSGREREQLFDMESFGEFEWRRGLTFTTRNGRLRYGRTLLDAAPLQFLKDVRQLDVRRYDLIVTDYEPVTAWAARLQRRSSIGIGHQYAFRYPVPEAGGDPLARWVMRDFAPVQRPIGLHWHGFGQPIMPPIIDTSLQRTEGASHILVYLPFEDQAAVTRLLRMLPEHRFIIYAPHLEHAESGNVSLRPSSLQAFRRDLCSACRVICNAGFELVSECLHLGLPVLVKPLEKQMEQASNAAALEQLGWGRTCRRLDARTLREWLESTPATPEIRYPDVAAALVEWLCTDPERDPAAIARQLWQQCGLPLHE